MKGYGLLLAAVVMLLLTGWVLHKTNGSRRVSHVRTGNPMETSAGWRYRQNQPHHWRCCLLQN